MITFWIIAGLVVFFLTYAAGEENEENTSTFDFEIEHRDGLLDAISGIPSIESYDYYLIFYQDFNQHSENE